MQFSIRAGVRAALLAGVATMPLTAAFAQNVPNDTTAPAAVQTPSR